MIVVHHLNNSRSQRILWLLEELGLDYEIKLYQRDPQTMLAPPELRAVHPLGKSPVVTDGGLTLAESGAIIEYLIERYGEGKLAPARDSPDRIRYLYWLHYAEGSAMPPLLLKLVFDKIESAPMPFFVRPVARGLAQRVKSTFVVPQLEQHLDFLEAELGAAPWFVAGTFSGADIQLFFPLEAATSRAGLGPSRPNLWGFLQRAHARPAYQRALQKGGAFTVAT